MATADTALLAIAFLLLKHAVADFMLQTPYQWQNKGRYGHPGGIVHAGIHVLLSSPLFMIMPAPSLATGTVLLLAEFLCHYHIDWTKEFVGKACGIAYGSPAFWRALGIDQAAHGLTYVAMVSLLADPLRLNGWMPWLQLATSR